MGVLLFWMAFLVQQRKNLLACGVLFFLLFNITNVKAYYICFPFTIHSFFLMQLTGLGMMELVNDKCIRVVQLLMVTFSGGFYGQKG